MATTTAEQTTTELKSNDKNNNNNKELILELLESGKDELYILKDWAKYMMTSVSSEKEEKMEEYNDMSKSNGPMANREEAAYDTAIEKYQEFKDMIEMVEQTKQEYLNKIQSKKAKS